LKNRLTTLIDFLSKPVAILTDPETVWTCRQAFFTAFAVAILISFTGVFDHSLWSPDEPRVAEIGREMLANRDLIVPTLAGKPFLEKPPLYWWVMTGLYHLFGVSDGVARTTSAIAGTLVLLLTFDVTRRVANPFAGLMATLVAATMGGFYNHFHRVVVDPWLAFFVMLGYWGFVVAAFRNQDQGEGQTAKPSALGIAVIYLAGGFAFLTKGPVGPALLAGPMVLAIIARRQWSFFRSWMHMPAVLIFLTLCLAWPVMLYQRGGKEFLDGFVIQNGLYRFLPQREGVYMGGHKHPLWYYLSAFPGEIAPWLIALPAVGYWLGGKRWPQEWNRSALVFLASIFPVGLILLSIPGAKRHLYLLPLIAPLAATIGAWIAATVSEHQAPPLSSAPHRSSCCYNRRVDCRNRERASFPRD